MKDQIVSIAKHFGNISECLCTENFQSFECEIKCPLTKIPSPEIFQTLLPNISERDNWRLLLLTSEEEDLFDIRKGANINTEYDINRIEPYKDDEVHLVYSIDKNKRDDIVTIYEYEVFAEYVKNLSAPDFFSILKSNLGNRLNIEIWSDEKERFASSSIVVFGKNEQLPILSGKENDSKRIDECKAHCQWNNKISDLLPEDLYIQNKDKGGKLSHLFDQMCLLLSALYVADFSSIDKNGIQLRISGFKMMTTEVRSSKISDISFDMTSMNQWYKIYDWCYTGGYISERLSIARNLISLNCIDNAKLLLNPSTFDAIKSNFKIFEKDNVRQYIKVRNEVSKTLLDLQDKVNLTVETFTGDFRKNVAGLGTFFLTMVVVRVVAKGDWYGAFSSQIVVLSFIFVLLSTVILCYSRKAMDKKEELYTKHYGQLRRRYEALLSKEELDELFEDGDPNKSGSHSNYIQWQKNKYTRIWGGFLIVCSVFLMLIWCYNMFEPTNIYKILKTIIECCIKNI